MIWRTCGSQRSSSARSAYSTRAVGFVAPEATRPEVLRRVGVVAQLAQATSELRRGPEGRHPIAADQPGDRRVIDARLLGELALRHLLGLELGSKPFVERSAVLGGHAVVGRSVTRASLWCRDVRMITNRRGAPVSPVRTGAVPECPLGGAVRWSPVGSAPERTWDSCPRSACGEPRRSRVRPDDPRRPTMSAAGTSIARGHAALPCRRSRPVERWRGCAEPTRTRCGCLADPRAAAQAEPRSLGRTAMLDARCPRGFGESEYATEPKTMIESTLMTRSSSAIAVASGGGTP